MAINFPSTAGQATDGTFKHTDGGVTWSWDGSTWTAASAFTETDPVFSASAAGGINNTNITNWNAAYNWGNHASEGYLLSYSESDTLNDVVTRNGVTTQAISLNGDGSTGTKLAVGGTSGSSTRKLLMYTTSGHSNIITEGTTGTGGDINIQAQSNVNILASAGLDLYAGGTNPAVNKLVSLSPNGDVSLTYQGTPSLETMNFGAKAYGVLEIATGATTPTLQINNNGDTNACSFVYAHDETAAYNLPKLPTVNGSVLTCSTLGEMTWSTSGGGSSLQSRSSAAGTTTTITNNQSTYLDISSVAKTYALHRIETSAAAWVTLYVDDTSRTNDNSRSEYTDPTPGSGVVAEVITSGDTSQMITPGVIGWNNMGPVSETVFAKVVNKSGSSAAITVTLHFVKLED